MKTTDTSEGGSPWLPQGQRPARCRGATVLEVALVAPLVLMLLLGMADLGIAIYGYNTIAESVRVGTRYAVVRGSKSTNPVGPSADNASVESVVRSHAPGIDASNLTVRSRWPDGNNTPGSRVTVAAAYDYRPAVTWIIGFTTLRLRATSTMVISN